MESVKAPVISRDGDSDKPAKDVPNERKVESVTAADEPVSVILPPPAKRGSDAMDEVSIPGGRRVLVRYIDENHVEITYKGKKYNISLRNPNDQIRLRFRN